MARKSRKQKTAAKKAAKASRETIQYEAAFGSKAKMADALTTAGLYKSKKEARRAVDRGERGERLSDTVRTFLDKQGKKADKAAAEEYAEKIKKPREQRAATTNIRRKANKEAIEELKKTATDEGQRKTIENARSGAAHVFSNGVVRYGNKAKGPYVRVIGIVNEYHGSKGPIARIYTIPLYETAYSPARGRMVTRDVIPGIRQMSAAERAEAIALEFEQLTGGHGILKAFQYIDKEDFKHGKK